MSTARACARFGARPPLPAAPWRPPHLRPLFAPPARNFKLLDELEEAEKGSKGAADISLGLADSGDSTMTVWQASIIVAAGGGSGEPRMWSLRMTAGKDYPKAPPSVQFISRITMDGVDARGNVALAKVPYLASWNPGKCLHGVLTDIKSLIARAPKAQPPDGSNF